MFLVSHLKVKSTKKKGRGVFTTQDIPPGKIIGDYVGKIVRDRDFKEGRDGLYAMYYTKQLSIFADPCRDGVHLINHSCAPNCDAVFVKGHTLIFSLRKIFAGEELSFMYGLDPPSEKTCSPCLHACNCGAELCRGTMHLSEKESKELAVSLKRRNKRNSQAAVVPGKYLPPLSSYPSNIPDSAFYDTIFGYTQKPPLQCSDRALPSLGEIRKRIRETGRTLRFPKVGVVVEGLQRGFLIVEPLKTGR